MPHEGLARVEPHLLEDELLLGCKAALRVLPGRKQTLCRSLDHRVALLGHVHARLRVEQPHEALRHGQPHELQQFPQVPLQLRAVVVRRGNEHHPRLAGELQPVAPETDAVEHGLGHAAHLPQVDRRAKEHHVRRKDLVLEGAHVVRGIERARARPEARVAGAAERNAQVSTCKALVRHLLAALLGEPLESRDEPVRELLGMRGSACAGAYERKHANHESPCPGAPALWRDAALRQLRMSASS